MTKRASPGRRPDRNGAVDHPIDRLRKGDRIQDKILLVETSNFKQTRDGKFFIQMVLRDRTQSIRAIRWEASHELYAECSTSDFVQVSGRVEEFQQNPQLVVDEIRRVANDEVNFEEFLPTSDRPPEEMEKELLEHVAAMSSLNLRDLLTAVLSSPEIQRGLRRCPAGKKLHHAYIGGLLEHILSLVNASKLIASNYEQLDEDLLVAASILHDIGKVREFAYERGFSYTDEGQLVGHIGLGLILITETATALPSFPPELLVHLQHIISSHHGIPEHGALKLPMTPEAIAFHFLDNLDAKMAMLSEMESDAVHGATPPSGSHSSDTGGRWTEYKPALNRRIYFTH